MKFLDKAKRLVAKNDQQVKKAIGKAAELADEQTKGKHRDRIDDLAEKATRAVDDLPEK